MDLESNECPDIWTDSNTLKLIDMLRQYRIRVPVEGQRS